MCIHLKIYEITFVSFCVFPLNYFDFFKCFYCFLLMLSLLSLIFFVKIFPCFYDQVKHKVQTIGSILPPRIANRWKLFKPNKTEGLVIFWEVKMFGWFTRMVIREHSSGSACSYMALYYTQNYIQDLDEGLAFANKLIDFCLDTVCFLVFKYFLF